MKVKGLVYGVGINDVDCVTNCPFYSRWTDMLARCYSERFHIANPSYKGCSVCEEWKTFSNFKKWMEQDNWKGKQLDKDILVPENKEYGPNTCIFVSHALNGLLIAQLSGRGKYPTGVSLNRNGYYLASLRIHGKNKTLGRTKTVEEASLLYKKARYEYLLEWSNNLTSEHTSDIERTKEALIRHAGLLLG
jgi:hypothetical protein